MKPYAVVGDLAIGGQLVPGAVVVKAGRVVAIVRPPRRDQLPSSILEAPIIAPGLIDLQVNGGWGVEVGEDPDAIKTLAARLPETGVTSFLPTAISSPAEFYPGLFTAFATARNSPGACPLGLHLEGPFLSPARHGAHRRDIIERADAALFDDLLKRDGLCLMTLAPERPDALDQIHRLRQRGIVVSLGHTDASNDEFVSGLDAGATMATHLFNAMSPFAHRAPGAIGAALVDDRVTVGLIADGVHSHPAALQLALKAKGPDRIALVSDMMSAAGMPPGRFTLDGRPVIVDRTTVRLENGTLAGSILTLDQAVSNVIRWTGLGPAAVLAMASTVPARLLGLNHTGHLTVGTEANFALFDRDLNVLATIVNGLVVYQREEFAGGSVG